MTRKYCEIDDQICDFNYNPFHPTFFYFKINLFNVNSYFSHKVNVWIVRYLKNELRWKN